MSPRPGERVLHLDDPRAMRALAHPMRMRALGRLRTEGPATASELAAELGASTPLLSYHLRQLARHGFVEEAPELARDARERPWRSSHDMTSWSSADFLDTPERMAADDALTREVFRVYGEALEQYLREAASWGPEWLRGKTSGDRVLRLTAAELDAMREELWDVVERYADREPAAGTERIRVILHAFPFHGPRS